MSFYLSHAYPWLVDRFGNPPPVERIRRELIPRARGTVLEIGAGSGANFPHYDASKVQKLYALEPNTRMVRLAERKRAGTSLNVEFIDLPGEKIPLGDATIDTVVSTFTLCTIGGISEAIRGLGRVLRPEGMLLFFELGIAPDAAVRRWQRWLEPASLVLFQGLRLTRDIPALIRDGGFEVDEMQAAYMTRFPKALSYCWWGRARRDPR